MFKIFICHVWRLLILFLIFIIFLLFLRVILNGVEKYNDKNKVLVENNQQWQFFNSLEHGFKVAFIGYPKHDKDVIGVFNSSTLINYDSYTFRDDDIKITQKVSVLTYPKDLVLGEDKELLINLMNQFSNNHANGKVASFSFFSLGKYSDQALDFEIDDQFYQYDYRIVSVARTVYILLNISPLGYKNDIKNTFFDSFELF